MSPKKASADFWARVRKGGAADCWLWTGNTKGRPPLVYGSVWFQGRHWSAHRLAWVLTHGNIPLLKGADTRGTCVRHTCDTPLCVRPDHLELGTHQDNMLDKVERNRTTRAKTHCKRGHPRTPENLYRTKQGPWQCRPCHALKERARRGRTTS